ncbi:MAG: xanthine dehydrogenase family protein molybdopterin-binding subunit [Candidatus Binatia bacterium]
MGRPLRRKEDVRLLTGRARFLEDIRLPGMLYARILRSPLAHARIRRIDTGRAKALLGVHAVISGRDVADAIDPWGHRMQGLPAGERYPFAIDKVIYEGQEVAAVAADTDYQARDGIEAIAVEYEELPVVVDPEEAMRDDAPLIQETIRYERGRGNAFDVYTARIGNIDEARAQADVAVRGAFVTNRIVGAALEHHGCIADYDGATDKLTIYTSTQSVYLIRDLLAETMRMPANRVRVIAVDVGAGFGSKADLFPHEVIATILSLQLARPVRLMLSRADVFRATTARCNQVRYAQLYATKDGRIIGYKDHVVHNAGAASMWGNQVLSLGTHIGLTSYPFPNVYVDGYSVHTNTIPGGALRGFGVPQTVFALESLVDMAAEAAGIDPVEFRLRNVVRAEQCPFTNPMGHVIDSTSLAECIAKAAEAIEWQRHRREKKPYEGVGIAIGMKHTAGRHPCVDTDLSAARLKLETDGTISVYSGDVPHGQGHQTMLSQIVGDAVGVSYDRIEVISADTETSLFSLGTYGSRAAAVLGAAVQRAAEILCERILRLAGHLLEVSPSDLEIRDDTVFVRGVPGKSITVAEVAGVPAFATHKLPPDVPPGSIEAVYTYDTPTQILTANSFGNIAPTYSGAAHAARVRVDPGTGRWTILDYAMAHDSGSVVNPLIVGGQHHGAFLHGFGMAFGEGVVYDQQGHMLNASFASYLAPYAPDLPDLSKAYEVPAPSTVVPGGRKGAGESGTGPVPPAIANALYHAIGVRFTSLPITPDKVLDALREKEARGVATLTYPYDVPSAPGPHAWPDAAR